MNFIKKIVLLDEFGDDAELIEQHLDQIDVADLTYLVAYQFKGGPAPPACP